MFQSIPSTGSHPSGPATGDSLLFSTHLKRSMKWSNACSLHSTIRYHIKNKKKTRYLMMKIYHIVLVEVIGKTFSKGTAFKSPSIWLTREDLASTELAIQCREPVWSLCGLERTLAGGGRHLVEKVLKGLSILPLRKSPAKENCWTVV